MTLTFVIPSCECCDAPRELGPRDDVATGMAACPQTGELYRPEGQRYIRTTVPQLNRTTATAPQTIDLSRTGYS